ncbi:MAG TPA: hemolysin family protein [Actinomycetota bacterium]|nr:hemolysin family protein [Actinomycetota bacterium]
MSDVRTRAFEGLVTGWKLASIFVLVAANAFFVAAEFGLVAVRRTRIEELISQGSRRAATALKVIKELNLMLSGCQLGITFASLGLGAVGEPVIGALIEGGFEHLQPPFDVIATHAVATAIAFSIITFLHVALGELVPKALALARPEQVALWVAAPMRFFTYAFRPVIWLFNEAANVVLRLFGVEANSELAEIHTPEEIGIIVEEARRGGTILSGQSRILARTLEFPEKRAVEAMVPRVASVAISAEATMAELLDLVQQTGYSRFPVWRERPDEFVGVVHIKDMLGEVRRDPDAKVKAAMRDALVVPESLPLERVLVQMRRQRNHMAIVLDEFGSTAGVLTLEDIIEELLGEIRDEYDVRERDIRTIEGGYRIPGRMRPDELEEATELQLPEGDYETVAGFILERLGRLAKRGDEITYNGWRIRVANVNRRRILSVDIVRPGQEPASEPEPVGESRE